MALRKSIETPSGVVATYWRVGDVYKLSNGDVNIHIEGYLSEGERGQLKQPVATSVLKFKAYEKVFDYDYLGAKEINPHKRIYELIKSMGEFEGAQDI